MKGKADIIIVTTLLVVGMIALAMVGFGWYDDAIAKDALDLSR